MMPAVLNTYGDWEVVKINDLRDYRAPGPSLYMIRYVDNCPSGVSMESFADEAPTMAFLLSKVASADLNFPLEQLPLVRQKIEEYLDSIGYVSSERLRLEGVLTYGKKSTDEGS